MEKVSYLFYYISKVETKYLYVSVTPKGHTSALLPDELREEGGDVRRQEGEGAVAT